MPEISRFFGIVICMYHDEHGLAHFHAIYGEYEASIEVVSERVHGHLPRRVLGLTLEWARLHRSDLIENWRRARDGDDLVRIAPLEWRACITA